VLPRCVVRGRQNPKHLSFSTRFRRARRQSALSLVDLAERAGLAGASVVRYLETGMRAPRLDTVERLAHGLGLSPAFLAFDLGADTSLPADGLRCEGIASRLRETRTVCGLTMRALARAAGLTDTAVRSTESGASIPSIATAESLAKALGVSPAWLAFGEGPQVLPQRCRIRSEPAAARS
jgi:transcriptional regulator with XRE-family HTH domain